MTQLGFAVSKQSALIWLFILWGINLIVFTPFITFNTYLFYKKRSDPFITKRRPLLVVILIIIILITVDVVRPLFSLNHLYPFTKLNEGESILWGTSIIFLISTLLFCRAWKIFFDFKSEEHLLDLKWMQIIRSHKRYVPWTIKYKFSGNTKLLALLSILLYTVLFTTTVLLTMHTSNPLYVTITLCSVLAVLLIVFICLFISMKLQLGHDFYEIHTELQYLSIISLLIFMLFAVDVIPNSILNIDSLIIYTLITATFIPLSLLQTKWVLHKQQKFLHHVSQRRTHGSIVLAGGAIKDAALDNIEETEAINKNDENNISFNIDLEPMKLKLDDVLKTEQGFKAFANHLVRELTVEHLLYIVECLQLKHEMLRYQLLNKEEVGWMTELPPQIIEYGEAYLDNAHIEEEDGSDDNDDDIEDLVGTPRSPMTIDAKEDDDSDQDDNKQFMTIFTFTDVIENFNYLCEFYIVSEAEHALNLSARVRKKLISMTTECKQEFEKLDGLHKITQNRVSSRFSGNGMNLLTPVPSAPRGKSPQTSSLKRTLSILSFRSLVNITVDDNENGSYDAIGLPNIEVNVCPTIRFGQISDILASEFEEFVSTPLTPMPTVYKTPMDQEDEVEIVSMIDCMNRSRHTFHYNDKHENVLKMKEMIINLVDQLDKSLYEVYRLIEQDSYRRFMDTHHFIALEKRAYKRVKKDSKQLSQSLNINLAQILKL